MTQKAGLEDEKKRTRCLFSGNGNHLTSQGSLHHTCTDMQHMRLLPRQTRKRVTQVRPPWRGLTRQSSDCKGGVKLESFKIFAHFQGKISQLSSNLICFLATCRCNDPYRCAYRSNFIISTCQPFCSVQLFIFSPKCEKIKLALF